MQLSANAIKQHYHSMAKRALTIKDIREYEAKTLPFEGNWLQSIGTPELKGAWIIWGNSTNGKTRFALQLARYLAKFVKVAYDSLEEGLSQSMKTALEDVGMADLKRNFYLLDQEPISELTQRLKKQRSPQVIFIDSLQYSGLTYSDYKTLRDTFKHKLFILISHAEGRDPKGSVGKSIRYDAFVKIYVEGYKAFPQSRYGGGEPYTIWHEGATKYWIN